MSPSPVWPRWRSPRRASRGRIEAFCNSPIFLWSSCSPRRASRGRIEAGRRLNAHDVAVAGVLHGERAVAALKRLLAPRGGPFAGVLHGERAVAALKHHDRGLQVVAFFGSPRRASRGRIEALIGPAMYTQV